MPLLAQKLVDLVVQITNAKLAQAGILNLRHFLSDLSDDLDSPLELGFMINATILIKTFQSHLFAFRHIVTLAGQVRSPLVLSGLRLLRRSPTSQCGHRLLSISSHFGLFSDLQVSKRFVVFTSGKSSTIDVSTNQTKQIYTIPS